MGNGAPFLVLISPSLSLLLMGFLVFLLSLSMLSYPGRRGIGMATIAAAAISIMLGGAQHSHAFSSFWNMNFLVVGALLAITGVLVHLDGNGRESV